MNDFKIIADVGINHNGDINIAKQLIKGAKDAGVDLVKFQKRSIEKCYTKEELDKPRESPWGTTNRDQKLGLELSFEDYKEIDRYCKEIGIEWFASAWDVESIQFLEQFNLNYNKIASARLCHCGIIDHVAKQKKYTYISTGMAEIEEIGRVVNTFRHYDCPFELMHCYSVYPANPEDLNLSMIPKLKQIFGCKVGYSGHEVGLTPSIVAVALGANSIERHITLNRSMYGSDQAASVEVQGFERLVSMIKEARITIGNDNKKIDEKEAKVRSKLWRNYDVY